VGKQKLLQIERESTSWLSGELALKEAMDLSQTDYVVVMVMMMMMMIRICPRSKAGPCTQWQWDPIGHVYRRVIQLSAVCMARLHTHIALM
jgi:hypothetical protein